MFLERYHADDVASSQIILGFLVRFLMNGCFCCVGHSFRGTGQQIGWEENLQNNIFCVNWDVKPQLSQPQTDAVIVWQQLVFLLH